MEPQGIYLYLTDENMNKRIPFKTFKICGEHVQPEHSHEYLQMWYVLKGRCTHFLNGHRYEYSRFGLFIIPPYATHHVETRDSDTELICCEFSERFINEALMDENRSGLFDFAYLEPFFLSENLIDTTHRIASDSAPEVEKLFLEIYDMFESLSKYARLFIKADLLRLLAIIASEYELGVPESSEKLMTKYHDAIDAALNFIDTHFDGKLYLEDVCRIALMSHSTFSYIFKQVTGQTFSEYVMKLRLSCACKLLDTTDMTITEICQNSGFGDSTYFTRMFKKRFGIPPSRYRADSGKKSDGSENN